MTRSPDWNVEGRDWPNRGSSRFVEAGGLRWHVQVMGEGPALLLLHGTGAATHSWRDIAPLLAKTHTVVAMDLPGHGFTAMPARPTDCSLPQVARRPIVVRKRSVQCRVTSPQTSADITSTLSLAMAEVRTRAVVR